MEKERNLNYWTIRKFSLLYSYYAIIDTTDYLADQLFVKNEVRVWFGQEYICPDGPYCVIFCKCRKRDAKQRGSWNGISPVTRIVPNGKAYDRNRIKREDHQFAE